MSLKNFARPVAALAAGFALVGLTLGMSGHTVQARSGVVPIEIDPDSVMTAGQTTPMTVVVSATPANVRIFTQPSGVIAYQGTVNSTTTTLILPVNPNAPKGSVTVTLSAEGRTVSSTSTVR